MEARYYIVHLLKVIFFNQNAFFATVGNHQKSMGYCIPKEKEEEAIIYYPKPHRGPVLKHT
jgi:hypothetical protein